MNFHTMLKEAIAGEEEDIARYEKMAAMASEEYAPILRDIAKEERQHLHHLTKIADKSGWMEVDERTSEIPMNSDEYSMSETPASPADDDSALRIMR